MEVEKTEGVQHSVNEYTICLLGSASSTSVFLFCHFRTETLDSVCSLWDFVQGKSFAFRSSMLVSGGSRRQTCPFDNPPLAPAPLLSLFSFLSLPFLFLSSSCSSSSSYSSPPFGNVRQRSASVRQRRERRRTISSADLLLQQEDTFSTCASQTALSALATTHRRLGCPNTISHCTGTYIRAPLMHASVSLPLATFLSLAPALLVA